jgi:glycosyltransferase involved in cell wall biosynthesis
VSRAVRSGLSRPIDVLVVVIDSTGGWIAAAEELLASLCRAGAEATAVHTGPVPRLRTFALTDLSQALLARRAASAAIAEREPRAIIYCSVVAALLWPRPGAIFLDSPAAENRPGRHGLWQRPVERRRLLQASLLLTWSERALEHFAGAHAPAVTLAPPIGSEAELMGAGEHCAQLLAEGEEQPCAGNREIDVLLYAGDPEKKRLELLLQAWSLARRDGETLAVAGLDGFTCDQPGVVSLGRLDRDAFRRHLRRARVFAAAPRREDFGIAPLEALAAGCRLVTADAPGPYPALELARRLDPRLVASPTASTAGAAAPPERLREPLARAIRTALDDPLPGYADRARQLLLPFTKEVADRTVEELVLPRLLGATKRPPTARA